MDEQTQTPPDVGASEQLASEATAPAQAPVMTEEQRLEKLLRNLLKGLVAAVAIFAVVYFFGQRQSHVEQAPSIPDQAVSSAEAAVRATPNDLNARLTLASSYTQAGRVDDALVQIKEILKAAPEFQPALLGLGELMYRQGNLEEAKSALLKYVGIGKTGEFAAADPQLERAYYTLGKIELTLGSAADAVKHLERAVRMDSADADALYELGLAQLETEAFTDAVASFKRAVAFVPTEWCEPYDGLAKAYGGAGNGDGKTFAASMLRICNGGGMDSAAPLKDLVKTEFAASALFGLGQASEHDGDNVAALSYYNQELSLDRTDVAALSAIARLGATPKPQPVQGK